MTKTNANGAAKSTEIVATEKPDEDKDDSKAYFIRTISGEKLFIKLSEGDAILKELGHNGYADRMATVTKLGVRNKKYFPSFSFQLNVHAIEGMYKVDIANAALWLKK